MDIAWWFSLSGLVAILLAAAGFFAVLYTSRTSDLNQQLTLRMTGTAVSWPPPFFKICGVGMLIFGSVYASLSWLVVFATTVAEGTNAGRW